MNRVTAGILAAMTAMLLIVPAGAQKKSGADGMFEAARQKETLEGDLAGAIKEYDAIVAKYKSDRGVTAMALVKKAECYRKMGDSDSRKIYEQVVREYPDQKEAVAIARAQLGGVRSSGGLSKNRICPECAHDQMDFSPDGRLMAFTDWVSGDLALRDMSTGQVKRLMAKSGTFKDGNEASAEGPILSPDLRQIVYFWNPDGKDGGQLRVMQNEVGGKSRVLVDRPGEVISYAPAAWFPDLKSVLVVQQLRDQTRQLTRVSVSNGAVSVLKSLAWRFKGGGSGRACQGCGSLPKPSPDGRYLVYSALAANPSKFPPAATDPKDQHIYVLAADGSTETEIVKTPGMNNNPVWTPDGKHILFTSDRLGKFDLWSVAVQNGKATGAGSLVSSEIGDVRTVSLHDGSYYYTNREAVTESVNIADFAPSGTNQSRIAHPTETFIGVRPAWSPDGKSIGFKIPHPGQGYDVAVHSLETGDERKYPTNLGTTGNGAPPVWSHDGKSMLAQIQRLGHRVDLETGDFKLMGRLFGPSAFSADDKTVYAAINDEDWDKLPMKIRAMDLSTGHEEELFTMPEPGYARFLLTPNGRTFVISRVDMKTGTSRFARLNIDGTGYREIYSIAGKDYRGNFTLTQDGRWILLAKQKEDNNWQLIRVPIEGGAPEPTGVELDAPLSPNSIALSPDGSRIAFTTVKRAQELWSLDNVLSVLK